MYTEIESLYFQAFTNYVKCPESMHKYLINYLGQQLKRIVDFLIYQESEL